MAERNQIDCICQRWASMDLGYLQSSGTQHHPSCDGTGSHINGLFKESSVSMEAFQTKLNNTILETIRNARPGSYIDIRTEQGVDSFPVSELRALLPKDGDWLKTCDKCCEVFIHPQVYAEYHATGGCFDIEPILTPELATELAEKHNAKFMIIEA